MSQNQPIAVVDPTGVVWPVAGGDENPHLLDKGARYIYDEESYHAAVAAQRAEEAARIKRAGRLDPTKKPAKKKRQGSSKEIAAAVLGREGGSTRRANAEGGESAPEQ